MSSESRLGHRYSPTHGRPCCQSDLFIPRQLVHGHDIDLQYASFEFSEGRMSVESSAYLVTILLV
jgi:hypothetical protein